MRPNRVRERLTTGEVVVNGWLHIPSGWSAEVMAHAGYDSILIDLQHSMIDMTTALTMLQAISTTDVVPLARVSSNDAGQIGRLLDAGAYGIMCPLIDTAAQCADFVAACRYPPQGVRSLGPTRATLYAGEDYAEGANTTILTLAMVETTTALMNVRAIAATPGLDMIFVGTGDLGLSLRAAGRDAGALTEALATIADACCDHGISAGLFVTTIDAARAAIDMGYRFITLKTDSSLLREAAASAVAALRA